MALLGLDPPSTAWGVVFSYACGWGYVRYILCLLFACVSLETKLKRVSLTDQS